MGGLFASVITERENWPWTPFGMFSGRFENQARRTVFFGVTPGGEEVYLPSDTYWYPWPEARMVEALDKFLQEPGLTQEKLDQVMKYFAEHYANRQRTGEHSGPKIYELRMYTVDWRLRSDLANKSTPDRKQLIASWKL